MANYSVGTCFRLDWPREACEQLRLAVACVNGEVPLDAPEFARLGDETREIIRRALEDYESLGIEVLDAPEDGAIVQDADGMFAPHMVSDMLHAIMRDQDIEGVVAFSWSEECDKHRVNAFGGGGAVVSRDGMRLFHVSDWLDEAARELREERTPSGPAP